MKLINSVNGSRYKTIDAFFMDDYKWDFLADKYRITADAEEWAELEADYMSDEDTCVLYGDADGRCCLEIFYDFTYNEVERFLKNGEVILYTNEDKDFHILIQRDY